MERFQENEDAVVLGRIKSVSLAYDRILSESDIFLRK